jgi:hypothetical protein
VKNQTIAERFAELSTPLVLLRQHPRKLGGAIEE